MIRRIKTMLELAASIFVLGVVNLASAHSAIAHPVPIDQTIFETEVEVTARDQGAFGFLASEQKVSSYQQGRQTETLDKGESRAPGTFLRSHVPSHLHLQKRAQRLGITRNRESDSRLTSPKGKKSRIWGD